MTIQTKTITLSCNTWVRVRVRLGTEVNGYKAGSELFFLLKIFKHVRFV